MAGLRSIYSFRVTRRFDFDQLIEGVESRGSEMLCLKIEYVSLLVSSMIAVMFYSIALLLMANKDA